MPEETRTSNVGDISRVLSHCLKSEKHVFDGEGLYEVPAGWFYDLNYWDQTIRNVTDIFGPTFTHCVAMKAQSLEHLFKIAKEGGFGAECASIGEVMIALELFKMPADKVVFDSPVKTMAEIRFALEKKIHINLDNFSELERVKAILKEDKFKAMQEANELPPIGLRINTLVGGGKIAALSVCTAKSKFGILFDQRDRIIKECIENPFINCIHAHVGSGGMGVELLLKSCRKITDIANEVNAKCPKQIKILDIGGGVAPEYQKDRMEIENPFANYQEYNEKLRVQIPELFTGEFSVITEFGQSINAKVGFQASRTEYIKGTEESPIMMVHFGSDCCVRQCYSDEHKRRTEIYDGETGALFKDQSDLSKVSIAGPLCFQGDFVGRDIPLPSPGVKEGNIVVQKDVGGYTLSMYSGYCSRLAPPVYGYRQNDAGDVTEFKVIKPREKIDQRYQFWAA